MGAFVFGVYIGGFGMCLFSSYGDGEVAVSDALSEHAALWVFTALWPVMLLAAVWDVVIAPLTGARKD